MTDNEIEYETEIETEIEIQNREPRTENSEQKTEILKPHFLKTLPQNAQIFQKTPIIIILQIHPHFVRKNYFVIIGQWVWLLRQQRFLIKVLQGRSAA